VRVVEEKRVAGYDAAVLQAEDAAALGEWLKAHGYAFSPDLEAWLAPYTAAKWMITAFKVAKKDAASRSVATSAVRMSFAADRPFFPYREPQAQRTGTASARLLRVYTVAPDRMDASLEGVKPWPGKTRYARPLLDPSGMLAGVVAPDQVPPGAWLTVLEDTSSPRPGTHDVVFDRSASRSEVVPPPEVVTHGVDFPLPLDVLVGIAILVLVMRRRKRRITASE
jgi:hypothetical protein